MILSKTMREEDYKELEHEGQVIKTIHASIDMWYSCQHHHRLWEYALAQKALKEVFPEKKSLLVSDHGCGAGYLSPIMLWLGHSVLMYECWQFGNEEQYMLEQMRRTFANRPTQTGLYEMRNRPLGGLVEADKGVDAAFCISTLEHIRDYQAAFRDFLGTVKVGGMAMITTDFAEDEVDHYTHANLRAGKMFTGKTYDELYMIGQELGFTLVGGIADWRWDEGCKLVNEYGFASMVLRRLG